MDNIRAAGQARAQQEGPALRAHLEALEARRAAEDRRAGLRVGAMIILAAAAVFLTLAVILITMAVRAMATETTPITATAVEIRTAAVRVLGTMVTTMDTANESENAAI